VQTSQVPRKDGKGVEFKQTKARPPFHSGLLYKEVVRSFPALVDGQIKQLKFKVGEWSSTTIVLEESGGKQVAKIKIRSVDSGSPPFPLRPVKSAVRSLNGKLQVAYLKRLPVATPSGFFRLMASAVDVPVNEKTLKGAKAPSPPPPAAKPAPKTKNSIVYEGVDNSIAQQNARRAALKAVQEDIDDYAINGSISERHLKAGHSAVDVAKKVREAFYDHQEELVHKKLIRPKHRFID